VESEKQRLIKLGGLANIFGAEPTGAVLDVYLQALEDLPDEQFTRAISLAIKNLKFFPKPAELRELVGADGSSLDQKSETHKAWDILLSFVSKWVQSDVEGTYRIYRGVRSSSPPELSQRILDVVRRTGGWKTYKCMTNDDYPFVQKRFFEEYAVWSAVEAIEPERLLTAPAVMLRLAAPSPTKIPATKPLDPVAAPIKAKVIPAPLDDVQLRDRREMLRQQIESLAKRSETREETRPF
jgi:hypothetical protein